MLSRRSPARRRVMAAALTVAVAGVSPAPASGATVRHRLSGLEMVQESGKVSPYEARTAHCPEGKQPVGGGFDLPEGHSVAASFPVADSGWLVKARSDNGDTAPFEMTWYAMCATPSPGYRIIKNSGVVPNRHGVGMECWNDAPPYPHYEHMVNVGGEAKGPTAALTGANMSYQPSRTYIRGFAGGARTDSDTVEVDLYVICIENSDGSADWYKEERGSYLNGDGPTWACPRGTSSVGVGFFSWEAFLRSSRPHATGKSDWKLTGVNPSGPGYEISGNLICERY
ncbi:hypothetical protein [Actinomadura litoris]|uniref:Secreted protein n=1 Tax=Actinomadura litoris TaxID=2678616 RepID=A0A7K1L1M2_9ACTN|nr:hypothetical protein [Actinomadura litoris]MUN38299.1 hypothetical protein [Actinomadura litoris]